MAGVHDDQVNSEAELGSNVARESHPTMRCLNTHIIPLVAVKWHDLSLELLDVEQERSLQRITVEKGADTLGYCREMFRVWLESNTATWSQLMEASRRINLNDAARAIEQLCLSTGGSLVIYAN